MLRQRRCAIAAVHLRRGDTAAARQAFEQAIERVPHIAMARAGLALLTSRAGAGGGEGAGAVTNGAAEAGPASASVHSRAPVDAAIADAALLTARGDASAAAQRVLAALCEAPPGNAGWRIAIEPLLDAGKRPDAWAPVVAMLRTRAN